MENGTWILGSYICNYPLLHSNITRLDSIYVLCSVVARSLQLFLNQACAGRRLARTWFLEIAFVREVFMRVCVSAPPGYEKLFT